MSHFGREFNQFENGLPCPLKMFLVWHAMHKFQWLNLKSLLVLNIVHFPWKRPLTVKLKPDIVSQGDLMVNKNGAVEKQLSSTRQDS